MQRLNRFTTKLERFTRSPSPKRRTQLEHVHRTDLKVRSHGDPDAKIISPSSLPFSPNQSVETHKMKANAFEVVVDNSSQNTHPMDEPLILRNGKKLYPNSIESNNNSSSETQNSNTTEDLIILIYNIANFCFNMLLSFWKMDLHFNVSFSESSNFKIHIPTVILALISIRILFSITHTSTSPTYVVNSNSSNGFSIIPILIVLGLALYWFNVTPNSSNKPLIKTDVKDRPISNDDSNTLFSDNTSITENSLWSTRGSTDSNYESDITPPGSRRNSIQSFQSKLETRLYTQKPQIEKVKVVHRQEEKQRNKRLQLNLPIELKSQSQLTFDEISKQRRNELLNAFH